VILIGTYSSDSDVDDDFAVLEMQTAFGEVSSGLIDEMYLSKRKTSLEGFEAFTRGYPGGTPDASNPCTDNDSLSADDSSADGASTSARVQYFASGDCYDVISDEIRFLLSSSSGMSGGAMYYCWESDCADGNGQTSLQSYYDTFHLRGPRSADFRDSVLAVI